MTVSSRYADRRPGVHGSGRIAACRTFCHGMKKWAAAVLALGLSARVADAAEPAKRPADWATPVEGTSIQNLYRIEPGLFRGSQPTAAGFQELRALGVRTVLDLAGGKGDAFLVPDGSLKLVQIRMSAMGLHDDRVLEALRVMIDPGQPPAHGPLQAGSGSDRRARRPLPRRRPGLDQAEGRPRDEGRRLPPQRALGQHGLLRHEGRRRRAAPRSSVSAIRPRSPSSRAA